MEEAEADWKRENRIGSLFVCLTVPVQVGYGDDLSPDVVVESVDGAGVDEAVSHPDARLHHLLDLPKHLPGVGVCVCVCVGVCGGD